MSNSKNESSATIDEEDFTSYHVIVSLVIATGIGIGISFLLTPSENSIRGIVMTSFKGVGYILPSVGIAAIVRYLCRSWGNANRVFVVALFFLIITTFMGVQSIDKQLSTHHRKTNNNLSENQSSQVSYERCVLAMMDEAPSRNIDIVKMVCESQYPFEHDLDIDLVRDQIDYVMLVDPKYLGVKILKGPVGYKVTNISLDFSKNQCDSLYGHSEILSLSFSISDAKMAWKPMSDGDKYHCSKITSVTVVKKPT